MNNHSTLDAKEKKIKFTKKADQRTRTFFFFFSKETLEWKRGPQTVKVGSKKKRKELGDIFVYVGVPDKMHKNERSLSGTVDRHSLVVKIAIVT